ncbi:MAG TPA: tRNA (adenosine(37)-N6)-threonylcarbamoyltransferase complex ATPase subunit type 1 TsaE [Verrucomicrobiae bacterium]|nr:tRNA (adenosine(37)-N6)-threonylcarbamoyltransferase complex ATPase subunit type 1 TsaE [Verrucomicrobiae bacterium]
MITSQRVETRSLEETLEFGGRLARELQQGDVIALSGELGAGKTALVKGIARGLGITVDVTSPTFTLIHEYNDGRLPLFHIDLYRLDSVLQALAVGIEDYLGGPGVTVVEWAERIAPLLPPHTIRIHMESLGETTRRIEVA